jgi:hypothetical protein
VSVEGSLERKGGPQRRLVPMKQRTRAIAVLSGTGVAVVGAIASVVFFLQPWRTCDYEDSSAGCAMLPVDATIMAIAMWSVLVGLVIVFLALTLRLRSSAR